MVTIGNKTNLYENVSALSPKTAYDNVDMLFAELFSLVNFNQDSSSQENILVDNLNIEKQTTDEGFDKGSESKEVEIAKSLASIFYKELGIKDLKESNLENKESLNNKGNILNLKNFNSEQSNKNSHANTSDLNLKLKSIDSNNTNLPKNINQNEKIVVSVQNSVKKVEGMEVSLKQNKKILNENQKHQNLSEKANDLNNNIKNNEVANSIRSYQLNPNRNKANKQTDLIEKKEKKKLKYNKTTTNEVPEEKINKQISKEVEYKPTIINRVSKQIGDKNISQKDVSKGNTTFSERKPIQNNNQNFNTQQVLDLMESSWGDKFTKMIKNAVSSGLNRVDLYLKPRNLGKLNVEISVKNNLTEIQINTENQEAANLLNENLSKITELIEEKNTKLSNFSDNQGNNFFNQKNKSQSPENERVKIGKKDKHLIKKTKENEHSIDVKA